MKQVKAVLQRVAWGEVGAMLRGWKRNREEDNEAIHAAEVTPLKIVKTR